MTKGPTRPCAPLPDPRELWVGLLSMAADPPPMPETNDPGFLAAVVRLHGCNLNLWELEDRVRRSELTDAEIVSVKRGIDRENLRRHDAIEALDRAALDLLDSCATPPQPDAPLHTESPAMVIDRLSVLALRIHHLRRALDGEGLQDAKRMRLSEKQSATELQVQALIEAALLYFDELSRGARCFSAVTQVKWYGS